MKTDGLVIEFALAGRRIDVRGELETFLGDLSADQVLDKTGARFVYRCESEEDAVTLAVAAYERLRLLVEPEPLKFDNLIFVTENPRCKFPGNGSLFASQCGLPRELFVLDINAGCTGFVDALITAFGLESSSLIVCSETYSRNIKSFSRAVSPIFSDGASVVLFDPKEWRLVFRRSICDAANWNAIMCEHNGSLKMVGSRVFDFVNACVVPLIREGVAQTPVDYLFVHQGSRLVVDHLKSRFELPSMCMPTNMSNVGNIVSATLPKLIYDCFSDGKAVHSGCRMLLAGFGVGLSASVLIIEKR